MKEKKEMNGRIDDMVVRRNLKAIGRQTKKGDSGSTIYSNLEGRKGGKDVEQEERKKEH